MGEVWSLAKQIADFRAGNGLPRATPKEALADIETYSCERLHDDPEFCTQKKTSGVRAAISRQFAVVKAAAAGGSVLVDWLGDGARPVPIEVAQARANVCLECPHNRDGHALLNLTADTVRAIAEQMHARESLKLRVEGEENLHSCAVCRCPLKLKVHVTLATILEHTDKETLSEFPKDYCWIITEQQTP